MRKVINRSRARVRGLDVDGINACKCSPLRPRVRVRGGEKMLCIWREACKAADYVLEDVPGPQNLHGEKIMKCLKIKATVYYERRSEAEKYLV